MKVFDSHAHLDDFVADGSVEAMLTRARAAGVERITAIGGSVAANERAIALVRQHPRMLRATVGYDRDLAGSANSMEALHELAAQDGVCAIGETGLDYHYEPHTAEAQKVLFRQQLDLAAAIGKPVVVHSRDADHDTLELLTAYARRHPRGAGGLGVVHCFTSDASCAAALVETGLHIGISGIVTFKNAGELRAVARNVPLDRILVETDAPYLAPAPYRGKRNEPTHVIEVLKILAELRALSLEEMCARTYQNACQLFQWPEDS